MVDALKRIHAALVPGGVLVDTQPVSLRLPVALDGEPIGELEDDEWLETVAAVDGEAQKTLAAGLFELSDRLAVESDRQPWADRLRVDENTAGDERGVDASQGVDHALRLDASE